MPRSVVEIATDKAGPTKNVAGNPKTRPAAASVRRDGGDCWLIREVTMNIERVQKKLGEARFFLEKMREDEAKAFGDKAFEFYLSAFLNAGRTVDYRLRHEHRAVYEPWRDSWNKSHLQEDELIKFVHEERREEVHQKGSRHSAQDVNIPVRHSYSDASGTLQVFQVPLALRSLLIQSGEEFGVVITKQEYYFTVDGDETRVVDVCAKYLGILEEMLAQFQADNP